MFASNMPRRPPPADRGGRGCYLSVRMRSRESLARAEGEGGRAYLFMLLSSLAFASMGAFSHLAGERCDWHLVAVARSSLAFVLTLTLSLASGVRLVLFRPAVLWMRSVAGSLGV